MWQSCHSLLARRSGTRGVAATHRVALLTRLQKGCVPFTPAGGRAANQKHGIPSVGVAPSETPTARRWDLIAASEAQQAAEGPRRPLCLPRSLVWEEARHPELRRGGTRAGVSPRQARTDTRSGGRSEP